MAVDPDTEVSCAAEVSPATTGDATVAPMLLDDLVQGQSEQAARAVVYGDSAYGTGTRLAWLDQHGFTPMVKAQLRTAPGGRFAKDQFRLDLQAGTVICPPRVTVRIRPARRGGGGRARFGHACGAYPLRDACTTSLRGRVVAIHPREAELTVARTRQRDPSGWLTIGRPDPRWNASWRICCAAAMAAAAPGCAGWSGWPRTSSCWPPR